MNNNKPFPVIKSKHSLVNKYLTPQVWDKIKNVKTKTTGFTVEQAVVCALQLDNQHVGIYAGDEDSYFDFKDLFHPLILDYHGLQNNFTHKPNMDYKQVKVQIEDDSQIESTRIRVARNVKGFGLSPGITREQRIDLENMLKGAFSEFSGELRGNYYPLQGMNEQVRKQLIDDHFLFVNGDDNLILAGMERDWPEGRGIFHNSNKTALVWVNEEDQLRIISMQKGGNVNQVFQRLSQLIGQVEQSIHKQGRFQFSVHPQYGYLTSCPSNLGTGMRASVHVHLPGWLAEGKDKLKARCNALGLQPRGARGESGGDTGDLFDISNKFRLGYSEVELVNMMINGVNTLIREDKEFQKKHGIVLQQQKNYKQEILGSLERKGEQQQQQTQNQTVQSNKTSNDVRGATMIDEGQIKEYLTKVVKENDCWNSGLYKDQYWRSELNQTYYKSTHNESEFEKNELVNATVVEKPFNMRKTRISEFSNAVHNGRVFINPSYSSC